MTTITDHIAICIALLAAGKYRAKEYCSTLETTTDNQTRLNAAITKIDEAVQDFEIFWMCDVIANPGLIPPLFLSPRGLRLTRCSGFNRRVIKRVANFQRPSLIKE